MLALLLVIACSLVGCSGGDEPGNGSTDDSNNVDDSGKDDSGTNKKR